MDFTYQQGVTNVAHVNTYIGDIYNVWSTVTFDHTGLFSPPVFLDLNGNGLVYKSINESKVIFDINLDGISDNIAWVNDDDGILVWDKDHNNKITDSSEFEFQKLKTGAATDLEGLQALDTNGNGLLDAGDEKFVEFAVWQDANGNGVTDAGEFRSLEQMGIASINLHSNGQMRSAGTVLAHSATDETDVTVMGEAAFTRTDGTTGLVADAMLAYQPGQAEINRMALLFNQMVNTAANMPTDYPLGHVPIETDVQLADVLLLADQQNESFLRVA
jgi:hypothetical protein